MKKKEVYIDSKKNILVKIRNNKYIDINNLKNKTDLIKLRMQEDGIVKINHSIDVIDFSDRLNEINPFFKENGNISIKKLKRK